MPQTGQHSSWEISDVSWWRQSGEILVRRGGHDSLQLLRAQEVHQVNVAIEHLRERFVVEEDEVLDQAVGLVGEAEALDRQPDPEDWPGRFVVFLGVSLQRLLPGEGFLALLAGEGGPGHGRLQSQVEFDAERGKYLDIITWL